MKPITYLFFSILIFVSCTNRQENIPQVKKLDEKHEPYDHEMLRLFGPNPTISQIQAFQKTTSLAIEADKTKSDIFNGEWELQGPGNIGGRVNSLAVDSENASIIYAGFARGGLWKTENNGDDWIPLWNDMSPRAISAIALVPGTDIVYVGTGDVNVSGSPYVGDGLYKSDDGGETWTNIGLGNNYIIGDIIINAEDPNIITVGTMGLPFVENQERGIFHTTDGGLNWTQALFIDEQTGVSNMGYQSQNPDIMLAGAWTRIRNGKESIVSGEGSGVYRSIDKGASWERIDFEVPDTVGRVAVTFSKVTEGLAYAMFIDPDHRFHSLHKSIDAGETWAQIAISDNETPTMMGGFAWFFGKIASLIDPNDGQEKLYLCGVDLWSFNEELNSWEMMTPPWWEYTVHADKHDIMNDADNNIIVGTDGGVYRTEGNDTWDDIEFIPTNMFYRVAVNNYEDDTYYGGMQDNGTSGGNDDILNDWPRIFGGDGFQMAFDPSDQEISYVETQRGRLYKDDGYGYSFMNSFPVTEDRRNWDMPYMISPHDPKVLYTGTYRAVKITFIDGEEQFTPISESLTDDVEFITSYHTITALDQSPLDEELLYYGTADGNVWKGEDELFFPISEGLPKFYISSIKASPTVVDRVYVTVNAYMFDDESPLVYRSDDRGETWEAIGSDLDMAAVNDVYIYPDYQDSIMFVGTNIGVYATIDAGASWTRLGETMPYVPVRDLEINTLSNRLVAGTYGNSIQTYPIDSIISVFNELNEPVSNQEIESLSVQLYPNPTTDFLQVNAKEAVELTIFDSKGSLVKKVQASRNHTIDCTNWDAGTYGIQILEKDTGKRVTKPMVKLD